jgi:hypothetical protein
MYNIQRETLSPGRPVRYRFSDESGRALYTAERTEELFGLDQHLVFVDPAGEPIARLVPPEDRNPWGATHLYRLIVTGQTETQFTIEQTFSLVDRLLLRLPRYRLQAGNTYYKARGSRHGEHFYELFDNQDRYLGQIERSVHGPTFTIEGEPSPLMQVPLLLAAFVIVIDLAETDN